MKPCIAVLAFLTVLSFGCSTKNTFRLDAPIDTIKFQQFPEVSFQGLPGNLIKNKKYINLAMNKDENYVGIMSKVSVLNNKIYILDRRKHKLAIFDTSGNYLGIIDRMRKDYANLVYFDVDSTGTIYCVDGKLDNFLVYNPALRLINIKKSPFEIDIAQVLPHSSFLLSLSSWNKGSNAGDNIIITDHSLKPLQIQLPYSKDVDDDYWVTDYRFVKTDKAIFYNRSIDNNVYEFSLTGRLRKAYYFDFGVMNVPDGFKKDIQANMPKFDHYRLLTDFTVVTGTYAIGKIWDQRKYRFFYLDRVNKKLYLEDLSEANTLNHIADFDGKHLYTYIYPGEYDERAFARLPENTKKHLQYGGIVVCDYELN
jgi:hypothetical protein